MNKIILISLVIFLLNNCTNTVQEKTKEDKLVTSIINLTGKGGRAVATGYTYEKGDDPLEAYTLKILAIEKCSTYKMFFVELKLIYNSIDKGLSFYEYICDHTKEMKAKIKKW